MDLNNEINNQKSFLHLRINGLVEKESPISSRFNILFTKINNSFDAF